MAGSSRALWASDVGLHDGGERGGRGLVPPVCSCPPLTAHPAAHRPWLWDRRLTMGTTASTAQQTVSANAPPEGLQSGSALDGRHVLGAHPFQTAGPHSSKAKSVIPNKVAPVVIT